MELSSHERATIVRLKQEGLSNAMICQALGISRGQVGKILGSSPGRRPAVPSCEALLSTTQAARVMNLHANTLRRWSNSGKLPSYRIGSRGDRRFKWGDIQSLLRRGVIKDTAGAVRRFAELNGIDAAL